MPAADLEEALQKKGGLTLEQLMIYDDIATDALVDRVYFWSTIRKARPNTRPSRGIREDEICSIIQRQVIIEKDAAEAQYQILKQHGMIAFMRTLHTADEREHFERHIRKYINIYLPECPFEVCTTYRYTIVQAEACVIARKPIRAGDTIKYLTGIQVELTEEEEKGLSSRTDFSIVLSSRRKRPSLFLGPARFANHDCDSNARLTTTGAHGLSIVARRSIAKGEEITVTYGDDYFGEDNCECLCGTCERLVRNGWDPRGPIIHDNGKDDSDHEALWPRKRPRLDAVKGAKPARRTALNYSNTYTADQTLAAVLHNHANMPKRRGRPRKHPLSTDRVDANHTANARDVLSRWFGLRANQIGFQADSDMIHVRSKASRGNDFDDLDIPANRRHYQKINNVFDLMAERGAVQLRELSAKLTIMNNMTASLLNIPADDVEKYYYPPGHALHVPLPTPPPSESSASPSVKNEPAESLTPFQPEPAPPMSSITTRSSRPNSRQQSSPLRKVFNADQSELAGSETPSAEQESPAPLKRKRGRPRKHPLPDEPVPKKLAREATNGSSATDGGSASSIFSGQQDRPTPDTSVSGAERFASGNICQNIVEMFVTDSPSDVNEARGGRRRRTRSIVNTLEQDAASTSGTAVNSIEGGAAQNDDEDEDNDDEEEKRGTPRVPGDYHMTPALLVDINDRWIECRNCEEYFVQHDAYLTRIACPRCERHSKLYGYSWPKTDKIGRDDKEERVLDHRLIHRFIEPEEERMERKGRKTLFDALKDRELSSSQEVEERGSRDDSRRRSRRVFSYA